MATLMTQAAYASSRGVSKQAIGDLVRRGILTLVDGKIDPAYADHQRSLSLNPAKSKSLRAEATSPASAQLPPSNVTQMSEYQRERAARERLERMSAQLDYDIKVGALIDRAGVLRAISEATRTLRDQMMGVARRVAPELAGCGDAQLAERNLEAEHRAALNQFAGTLIARIGPEPDAAGDG